MATYYWVGGTGTWNASSTTNWASGSGGSGGAGFPTSADDVIFDNNSNTGTGAFTVTATSAVCNNMSFGTGASALDGAMNDYYYKLQEAIAEAITNDFEAMTANNQI